MARPSFYDRRPQWGEGQRFHERIQLEPLSQLSSRRLVRELLKKVPEVPTALRDLVVDRADGNPFYIEELIKALIDDRVIVKGEETWSVDGTRLSTVRVPATLTGVLQSRLDTLPAPLQQLLQRASVVGRIFWDAAVVCLGQETAGLRPGEVGAMLEELRDREMILQREESGFAGTVEYVFRHAILRDVTYETVVPRQRRTFHRLVGDWLIEVGGERAGEHTLLVAEHYSRAEETALAAEQLRVAGERALNLAAFDEAATLFQRAREMLAAPEHTGARLRIDLLRADIEGRRGIYAKALDILKPALEEAKQVGDDSLQSSVLAQLGRIAMWQHDAPTSERYLRDALAIARRRDDKPALIFTLRQLGNLGYRTSSADSRRCLEESVELAREIGDRIGEASGLNSLGNLFGFEDDFAQAAACYSRAKEIVHALGDRYSESMASTNLGFVLKELGDLAAAEQESKRALAQTRDIGALQLVAAAELNLGDVCLRTGRNAEGWKYLLAAARTARDVDEPIQYLPLLLGILKIRGGDRATGLAWIGFARAHETEYQKEVSRDLKRHRDEIRGDLSEEAVEAAMRAGEGLTLEDILAQAEQEGP
jgi:tetratricopeptide (TPR) repeat protein